MSSTTTSVQGRLRDRLESRPSDRAWTFVQKNGEFEWKTFEDFYASASGARAALAEKGLSKGDVTVLVLQSDERAAEALMGSLLAGAVPLLVAPPIVQGLHSNLTEVVSHVVAKTDAKLVVMDDELAKSPDGKLDGGVDTVPIGSVTGKSDAPYKLEMEPGSQDIALMQLTSGTTGFPRICVWNHQAVLAALEGMVAAMRIGSDDVFVNWTPLYHDMGLVNNFLLCMAQRIPVAMMEPTSFIRKPSRWLRALSDTGATTTWSPNFGFAVAAQRAQDKDLDGVDLAGVKGFWNAAERVHYETMLAFRERFEKFGLQPNALKTNFGCAENIGGATFSDPDGPYRVEHVDRTALHHERVARPSSERSDSTASIVGVGAPYPGMTIHILDDDGNALPEGRVGQVALDTPSRMIGYLKDDGANALASKGEWVLTGDDGYMRDGELFWTGRVRERINIFGKKYDPSDFETALLDVEGLRPGCFAAFGVDDATKGTNRLVIVSEVRDDDEQRAAVIERVKEHVSRRIGVQVDEVVLLPKGTMSKTSSGKRRHRFYRGLFESGELHEIAKQAEVSG